MAKTATYTRAYAESNGFLTLLSDGERLTGAYALGPEAGEWLQQATLAIRARVPLDVLHDTIQPFPTFSEIYLAALKALRARDRGRAGRGRDEMNGDAMTTAATAAPAQREPELLGQTVVVIGGSAGIGLETARRARAEGAEVILTGRNPDRLAARRARARRAEHGGLRRRRSGGARAVLRRPAGPGRPRDGHRRRPVLRAPRRDGRRQGAALTRRPPVAGGPAGPAAPGKVRPGGTLVFLSGTGGRRAGVGLSIIRAATAAMPALVANLAVEVAPIRVNLIAPGFVDTPLSASLLGDRLDERRDQLRAELPIGRVVGPADVAALAVHLMTNTALTGATYDVDGGQQFV